MTDSLDLLRAEVMTLDANGTTWVAAEEFLEMLADLRERCARAGETAALDSIAAAHAGRGVTTTGAGPDVAFVPGAIRALPLLAPSRAREDEDPAPLCPSPGSPRRKPLWEIEHPYGIEPGNFDKRGLHTVWDCLDDFLASWRDLDPDLNWVVRWDWDEPEDRPADRSEFYRDGALMIQVILQRKPMLISHEVKVCRADEPAVRTYLARHGAYMATMWEGVDLVPLTEYESTASVGSAPPPRREPSDDSRGASNHIPCSATAKEGSHVTGSVALLYRARVPALGGTISNLVFAAATHRDEAVQRCSAAALAVIRANTEGGTYYESSPPVAISQGDNPETIAFLALIAEQIETSLALVEGGYTTDCVIWE